MVIIPQKVPVAMLKMAKTMAWGIHFFSYAAVTAGAVAIPPTLAMLAIGTQAKCTFRNFAANTIPIKCTKIQKTKNPINSMGIDKAVNCNLSPNMAMTTIIKTPPNLRANR